MDKMNDRETVSATTISDEEVITRVLQGERNLYSVIVRKYNQRLYRVGMSIVNSDSEVEDIMQTAYIKAYENLSKFSFRSSFATWLTRILINESLLRLKKARASINMNEETMSNTTYQQFTTEKQTPAMKVLNSELKTILEEAIRQLPEIYRTVFIMREIEDMNVSETKDCLGITEVNVKVRLNRAKTLLKNSLNKYYKKEDILHFHLSRCDRILDHVMTRVSTM